MQAWNERFIELNQECNHPLNKINDRTQTSGPQFAATNTVPANPTDTNFQY